MNSFEHYCPTRIVFGKGAEENTAALIKKYGGSRVLIVYGGGSAEKSGLLGRIRQNLTDAGLVYEQHGGVHPNPRLSHVREGIKKALSFGADFILAVGGGSSIDAAKAISMGAANTDHDVWYFWDHGDELKAVIPVGCVLTISAAGSETSNNTVVTNEETGEKRGAHSDLNRPTFAIMNPELTYTLPRHQIACGIVDIMMHTLDRYFTPVCDNEMTDEIAEGLLRNVIKAGRVAIDHPTDYQAMSELMWAGSLSHVGLTGLGAPRDFSNHGLGHELSAKFDVYHGESLSTVWGHWAQYCLHANPARFAKYARNVWGIADNDDNAAANKAIAETVAYFRSLDMPTNFTELGIGVLEDCVIADLAERATQHGHKIIGSFCPLDTAGARAVYAAANK